MMKKEMKDKSFEELLNEGYTEKEIAKCLNVKKVAIYGDTSQKNRNKSREFKEICLQIKEMIQERKTQEIIRYIDSIEEVEFLKKEEKCKLKEFKQEIIEKQKEKKVLKLIERNCPIKKIMQETNCTKDFFDKVYQEFLEKNKKMSFGSLLDEYNR